MNCKPGDIARIVEIGQNFGKLVRVVDRATEQESYLYFGGGITWNVEALQPLVGISITNVETLSQSGHFGVALDSCLRPLYDGDAQDETLTWAGKPEKVCA